VLVCWHIVDVGEQSSLGGTMNLPECSKQNIFKCMVCSPNKKGFSPEMGGDRKIDFETGSGSED